MVHKKSLDPYIQIFIATLRDVQTSHSSVFTPRALRLTIQKTEKRCVREGLSFLTKTLPRLGKALDRALTGEVPMDCTKIAFEAIPNTKLPKFMGELFQCVFTHDGRILPTPCVNCINSLRDVLYLFYKLELPYADKQEQKVLNSFTKTEAELGSWNQRFAELESHFDAGTVPPGITTKEYNTIRLARILLSRVFANFDPTDIHPKHGPGAVATREKLSGKFMFSSVSPRLINKYPLDAYFYASLGHVCDEYDRHLKDGITLKESPARVLLVPKDSRGPRLISCEPLAFQWIQQGLGRAIVQLVEEHPLTRYSVHFTDQSPNQCGALLGSITGGYATLDLNEASDRVTTGLVSLLFPTHVYTYLEAARSLSTTLPNGAELKLNKFAPMGSALCFPVLALTIWALLHAGLYDADELVSHRTIRKYVESGANESILVYGDDVIVPTAQAADAIMLLESFGLKVNRDKSCISGFFRESCGTDAYKGVNVTPVRIRTLWHATQHADSYVSYIAYANEMYKRGRMHCYDKIVEYITVLYGNIPETSMSLDVPSLPTVPEANRAKKSRVNRALQKLEYLVTTVCSPRTYQRLPGWLSLLRFFSEATSDKVVVPSSPEFTGTSQMHGVCPELFYTEERRAFSVSQYTQRSASYLALRWR